MNKRASIYIAIVALTAIIFMAALPHHGLYQLASIHDLAGFITFVVIAVITELMAIQYSVGGSRRVSSSISFLPIFACVVAFSPLAAVIAAVSVVITNEIERSNKNIGIFTFNISQAVLAYGLAALVYRQLSHVDDPLLVRFGAFVILGAVTLAINILLTGGFLSIRDRINFHKIFGKLIGPSGSNLWYDLLASPLAFVIAILYNELYIVGVLLFMLPLLLIRHSYESRSKLEQVNRELLGVLIKALETRDPYTSGHSIRVSILARMIGEELTLNRKRLAQVEAAALLHDIGKMDPVFSAVIAKRGSLSDDERALIRTHTIKGAELLETMAPSLGEVVIQSVRHHHEWFNGGGYPDGLKGDRTPLPARIIAVCDAIDAMLSVRPYRSARTPEQTRNELSRCVGGQFDPELTRVATAGDMIERAAERIRDIGEDDNTYIPRSA